MADDAAGRLRHPTAGDKRRAQCCCAKGLEETAARERTIKTHKKKHSTTDEPRWTQMFLKNQTLPLEPWVFEIEDEADAELGDAEIIYHLAALVIGDTVDDLRVHQDLVERNQIRNEQAHRYLLVQDLILPLLRTGNPSQPEFNYQ